MNMKTMEGLMGANTSSSLMDTPMRIYQEAKGRGDTAVMERAMGYAGQMADSAQEYQVKTEKGMEEEARETREKEKAEREKAIEKRREENEKLEERIREAGNEGTGSGDIRRGDISADTVEISEEGKAAVKESVETAVEAPAESVIYTKTGGVVGMEQEASISVSV